MKLAAAAYPIDWHDSWDSYEAKLTRWVAEAAGQGADLLVFPEYGAMELASLAGAEVAGDLQRSLHAVAALNDRVSALHARLAGAHGVHILAASGPAFEGARPVNRACLFGPEGQQGHQDKQIMTLFERDPWGVVPGGPLRVFDTALGRIGVLICYDSEFPLLGRALVEAGAEIILVPSCTDALSGYSRVRVGAMARALEGQCITIHAPTVGAAPWSPTVDENHGAAAIYGPPDMAFCATGVLAEGAMNAPGWVCAEIAPGAVSRLRETGEVRTLRHWSEQKSRPPRVETVPFGAK
ncbi:carbon-nitrogen hydrolase family protein [Actibacterium sp. MT2.3-13A]|uniref:carbon-nitrogen hydrolase family protein n=1 Tax=Actibacterium sp. MT2.3-13A TaxID=2828332 RepID=UPI001BACC4A3|nr:carbon-nitrogen hydrolase family protein [Actibacterium sp. MT2.3-13A]